MEVVSFPESEVPGSLRAQVLALQDQAWPEDAPSGETSLVHDPSLQPLSMILVEGGRVLAALDVLSKEIVHDGVRYSASGLSTVVTDLAEQRKGYGRRLVEAAREAIRDAGADLSIFTCDRHLQGFYERAGFSILAGTAIIGGTREDPFPSDRFDKVTVAAFFSGLTLEHADSFEGARIELYPGLIDKLW